MPFDIHAIRPASMESWLRFTLVPAVQPGTQHALLREFGSAEAALAAPRAHLAELIGDDPARALARGPHADILASTRRWLARPDCRLVGLGDAAYPALWKEIACPPTAFYAQGDVAVLGRSALAIVGSRNATADGVDDAFRFARELSERGIAIVSGLAMGIDASAHRGALAGGASTVAVLGTGPDIVYPPANAALAREIARVGCIVSEFPLGTPPIDRNFPRRNRLISGLASGVLVVEAAWPSGSLVTARCAVEQNRDVFAIPGSIHSPLSKGCHALIKQGAKLVDGVDDILQELGISQPKPQDTPAADEKDVFRAVGFGPTTLDDIAERTGLDAATLAARLSRLEIEGRVRSLAGGRYQRAEKRVIE
jgi:DNA processing protein